MIPYGLMYNLHRYNVASRERVRRKRARKVSAWVLVLVLAVIALMVLR